jgi:D-allose transport system substrate-binding protein
VCKLTLYLDCFDPRGGDAGKDSVQERKRLAVLPGFRIAEFLLTAVDGYADLRVRNRIEGGKESVMTERRISTRARLTAIGAALSLPLTSRFRALAQDATPGPEGTAEALYGGMTVAQVAEVKADQRYKLLAVLKTLANEYWQVMKKGYEDAATEKGVTIDVVSVPTEQDSEQQLSLLQQKLNEGYEAIMVSPITSVNLMPGLITATAKKIPIINVDEKVDAGAAKDAGVEITSVIASDNKQAGAEAAKYMIVNVPNGGKVAVIEGKAGNPTGQDRHDGFVATIEAAGNFTVAASQPADWDRARALNAAADILQANPDIVGIYACNDTMALGVVEAVKAGGKAGQVVVIGTDAIPQALEAIRSGDLAGTVAQYPAEEARIATSLAILALQGEPVAGFIPSPIKLLTKADVQ